MSRPTIALCMIVKDEEHNLPRVLESVEGCFDEIHITDTGSTDNTVEIAKKYGAKVHHFKWVNDFGAAREYSYSHTKCDYIMWLDADDYLDNKEAFKKFREEAIHLAEYWIATYHYANDNGKPVCSFIRERVTKNNGKFYWKYFVHEGLVAKDNQPIVSAFCETWTVKHMRSVDDLKKDHNRNLSMFDSRKDSLDARMMYYYGKELFESQKSEEAIEWFEKANQRLDLEMHDRILCLQYLCYSLFLNKKFPQAINIAHQGLTLEPHRAEFYCIIGDSFINMHKLEEAIPSYNAAKACIDKSQGGSRPSPLFMFGDMYGIYPRNQLAKVYGQMQQWDKAKAEAQAALEYKDNPESKAIIEEVDRIKSSMEVITSECVDDDAYIISCPGVSPYKWDPKIYHERGIGGSETAVVEMAYWLKKHSGKKVIVFNDREKEEVFDDVIYAPVNTLAAYVKKHKPKANISWRHNIKVTDAPTYLWCHDLLIPGMEHHHQYDKVLALSEFHKDFITGMKAIPEDKIMITSNGLNPDRFKDLVKNKTGNKVVYSSSPDRGLDRVIMVMDEVRKSIPDAELHVYYGFDNMKKMGLIDQVVRLEKMIQARSWINMHGNVEQKQLTKQLCEMKVWLYVPEFLETSCITAREMLSCGVYPVARAHGALKNTLKEASEKGMADLVDLDCLSQNDIETYAKLVVDAIQEKKYERVNFDIEKHSWENLAKSWLEFLPK